MNMLVDRRLSLLERELGPWRQLLGAARAGWLNQPADEVMGYPLLRDGDEVELTAGFALEALVAAVGRLKDLTGAAARLWPQRGREFLDIAARYELPRLVPALAERLSNDGELAIRVLRAETEAPLQRGNAESGHEIPDEYARFTEFCTFRRFTAKLGVLPSAAMYGLITGDEWLRPVSDDARATAVEGWLQRACRAYLAAEYLFPWIPYEGNLVVEGCHRSLFKFAGLDSGGAADAKGVLMTQRPLQETIRGEYEDKIRGIVGRLDRALQQVGSYEELADLILDGGGQWGPDSMIGSADQVNFIPANGALGECREVLVALVQGRRGARGLRSVLRQVREHLIRCGAANGNTAHTTRIVILVTDIWDPELLAESKGDFAAHAEDPRLPKTFVGVLVNGTQLSIQHFV